jgi:ferric-dicitrate binding protein FerR (iron transport regulator)
MEDFNAAQEELLDKYKKGICTPQEKAVVENWYNQQSEMTSDGLDEPDYDQTRKEIWIALQSRRIKALNENKGKAVTGLKRHYLSIAASLLIVVAAGLFFLMYKRPEQPFKTNEQASTARPGGNKAYLTLSNGKRIVLNDTLSGTLAVHAGVKITKTANGQIACEVIPGKAGDPLKYNTLEAPKGGQYQITLVDGTKIWLNAASVLKYPSQFAGKERKVELVGEAYFEVAKSKTKSFVVVSKQQEVQVLGTHFNINAYEDEASIKTTLVEGSVKITASPSSQKPEAAAELDDVILKPGQQSILKDSRINIKEVDTEEAVAWKNGYFTFENDNLEMIMRKLERWYDVKVVYTGKISSKVKVMGFISRNTELPELLKMLESTDKFKFKTEGRRVIVML